MATPVMRPSRSRRILGSTHGGFSTSAAAASTAAALAAAALVENPPCVLPRIRREPDGRITGVAMPGDPDYDDLP